MIFLQQFPERFGHHGGDGWFPFMGLFGLLLIAGVVVLVVALLRDRRHPRRSPFGERPGPPPSAYLTHQADDALNHLRLRYARGEVTRDDFFRMSADLGAPLPADPVPSVPTTAPPEVP